MSTPPSESAIPDHLVGLRSRSARVVGTSRSTAHGVFPRFPASMLKISVAYLGVQYPSEGEANSHRDALDWLSTQLGSEDAPQVVERSDFRDSTGFHNVMVACYWLDNGFDVWWDRIGHQWTSNAHIIPGIGRFAEIFRPTVDRLEAITDGEVLHGISRLAGTVSGPVREQGYWGSMRDRLPLAQTDVLAAVGAFSQIKSGTLVSVKAPSNLCIICTGQDWSNGGQDEQEGYMAKIEPTMRRSMDLLSSVGMQFGCLFNRYAWMLDASGNRSPATFSMSIWSSLAHLEQWAETHVAHLASYVGAITHLERFGPAAKFSRYHEVLVPDSEQMLFEYQNCHPMTGILRAAGGPSTLLPHAT